MKHEFFIPDFSVVGKFENVLQIHSDKESAIALVEELGREWTVSEVKISL
ncbi:MAG: hypothetical protein WC803_12770 [Sphingomonas sp.]